LTEHPDKSKAANATEVFRKISKAYEVLMGNESKTLFDYYLDHPRVCYHDDDDNDDSDSYDGIGGNDESRVSSSSDK